MTAAPPDTRRSPGAPAGHADVDRNGTLDTIRSIAVVRVVLWHTFATAALSWSVASMPAMFFVAGSLLAGSLDRRPARAVLADRLRRLLIPFWGFALVVLSVLAVVHRMDGTDRTTISAAALVRWLLPVADPGASSWEAGWITSPLWYLRCYLWLLVLSPLLRAAQRRFGPMVLVAPMAAVFVLDHLVRHPGLAPGWFPDVQWYLGDLAVYSFFVLLGFGHHDGWLRRWSRRDLVEWGAIALAAALLWVAAVDVPGTVVNNSYPLLLLVGIAWLAAFLVAEPLLGRAPAHPVVGPVVRWLGRRSMSVYLWHTTAIVAAYWLQARVAPGSSRLVLVPIVALGTVAATVAFGWMEDLGAGRPAQWWPGRPIRWPRAWQRSRGPQLRLAAIGAALGVIMLTFAVPGTRSTTARAATATGATSTGVSTGLDLPPAPSAKPDVADFGDEPDPAAPAPATSEPIIGSGTSASAGAAVPAGSGDGAADPSVTNPALQSAVDSWRAEHDVDGVQVAVSRPDGSISVVSSGTTGLDAGDVFPATSITKTMTAAIVLGLVDDGLIALDDPLPVLDIAPEFPHAGQVTIRQLLQHTSGIASYTDVAAFASARSAPVTPAIALELAASEPLGWEPGTTNGYSSTGFIILGVLAEQLTGRTFEQLLDERVYGPAGLVGSSLDTRPTAGWLGYSAGGALTTSEDLARWGRALFAGDQVLSADRQAEMVDVDNQFSNGLGAYPVCPCSLDADGARVYASIGHHGGQASVQYAPAEDLAIGLYLTESMWTEQLSQSDVAALLAAIRAAS